MRSWREACAILVVVIGAGIGAAACGNDAAIEGQPPTDDPCETSSLTYANFGEPFMLDWCRGCHSAAISLDMRQGAPIDANLEDLEQVRARAVPIRMKATGAAPTMPPAAGPSAEERALLAEWLECGAR